MASILQDFEGASTRNTNGASGYNFGYESDNSRVLSPEDLIAERSLLEELERRGVLTLHKNRAESSSSSSSSASSSTQNRLSSLFIADSGFGCVKLVVAGAKRGIAFVCCVKQAHVHFPKKISKMLLQEVACV